MMAPAPTCWKMIYRQAWGTMLNRSSEAMCVMAASLDWYLLTRSAMCKGSMMPGDSSLRSFLSLPFSMKMRSACSSNLFCAAV